ncbi:MAG: MBOAT family O-acyltransferase [Leptospiraceae bacterium]|nr:MBOAT family O-acyltransferase [Leptospiraceae bacterium]
MNLLLIASMIFYGSWNILFLFHFLLIIIINYFILEYYRKTRAYIVFFSLQSLNILNLVLFKYFYFLSDLIGKIFSLEFLKSPELLRSHKELGLEIILPLGISFYTFQIIAYGVDIYRNPDSEKYRLRDVILFISFFPQLIAGPILRSKELLPHISNYESYIQNNDEVINPQKGIWLILIGVIKKIFISDQIIPIINHYSSIPVDDRGFVFIVLLCIGFVIMLYSDFSAYSDIARGLGYLLGFEIPINFKGPFFMNSFTDLWKRWHISFSTWIRDYIFIPLGGNRDGDIKLYRNILITFSLAGIWHGANLTFLFWGLSMGIFLCIESYFSDKINQLETNYRFMRVFRITIVWFLYLSSGIFFFAKNLSWAKNAIPQFFIFSLEQTKNIQYETMLHQVPILFLVTLFFQWLELDEKNFKIIRYGEKYIQPIAIILVSIFLILFNKKSQSFIYFQF